MKKEIHDLILCCDSEDSDAKGIAITKLALLLEINARISNMTIYCHKPEDYKCFLDDDLITIRLDPEEESEIVNELIKRIMARDTFSCSMLWAIGKAMPKAGLDKLLQTIKALKNDFDNEESYQSIIALENFMDCDVKTNLAKDKEIMDFLENKVKSQDKRLSECAKRVLNALFRI